MCFTNIFILLVIFVPVGIVLGIIEFYSTEYQNEVIKIFLQTYLIEKLIYFLPAILIASLFYAINAYFPDTAKEKMEITNNDISRQGLTTSIILILITIIIAELLNTTLIYKKEVLLLKDKHYKIQLTKNKEILQKEKLANSLIKEKKYNGALHIYREIHLMMPNYEHADEKIKFLKEKIYLENEHKFDDALDQGKLNYSKGNFKAALKYISDSLAIKPQSKEAQKYYNLITQQLNIKQKKLVKDEYNKTVKLISEYIPEIDKRRKITELGQIGQKLFKEKEYNESAKYFKKILEIDDNNYDANYYLGLIVQRLMEISHYTNIKDKIIKKDCFFIMTNEGILLHTKTLGKYYGENYYFYDNDIYSFYNSVKRKIKTKKFGFYDFEKKKFKFIDSFIKDKNPIYIEGINPDTMWHLDNIINNPIEYPFYKIFSYYKYLAVKHNSKNLFLKILTIRIFYYILLLLLFMLGIASALRFRKKVKSTKIDYTKFIFLPLLAIVFDIIFKNSILFSKKIIDMSFNYFTSTGWIFLGILILFFYIIVSLLNVSKS